jgi:ABC-2 type transport system ATP-binding protein
MQPRPVVESLRSAGGGPVHRTRVAGGVRLVIERGGDGDHLIRFGQHPFHLSEDLGLLTCSAPSQMDAEWEHALLDWVIYSAAVLAGMQCIHASAIESRGAVFAFAAPSGGGKTTLAAELVRRGATFFCDDVLALAHDGDNVVAHPGPPFALFDPDRRELIRCLGPQRGTLGGETWVTAEHPARRPATVAAILLLDRHDGGPTTPRIQPGSFVDLRRLAIGIPRPGDREERRFSTLATLAEQALILRLTSSTSAPLAALAGSIEALLPGEGAAMGDQAHHQASAPLRKASPIAGSTLFAVRALCKSWGDRAVLDGLELQVERGAVVGICGANGTGKTTLLRVCSGLIDPDEGDIDLDGSHPRRDRARFQSRVGFLSAGDRGLYARLTGMQHLELWGRVSLLGRGAFRPAIERIVERLELADLVEQRMDRLSMGQRQRFRLAMAFLHEPDLVLLDEPLTSLDLNGAKLLLDCIADLTRRGGAVVWCSPSLGEEAPFDRRMALETGRLGPMTSP